MTNDETQGAANQMAPQLVIGALELVRHSSFPSLHLRSARLRMAGKSSHRIIRIPIPKIRQ
jgi:hypothetical protein